MAEGYSVTLLGLDYLRSAFARNLTSDMNDSCQFCSLSRRSCSQNSVAKDIYQVQSVHGESADRHHLVDLKKLDSKIQVAD